MPHARDARGLAAAPRTVRCRARLWHVVEKRQEGSHVEWRLGGPGDVARLIASPPDVVMPVAAMARRCSRRAWVRRVLAEHTEAAPVWWPRHTQHLPIHVLPYQYVPAMLVLGGHHRRLLVADDIGMGKTIEAAILLHEIHARDAEAATLVIVPAGLVAQWRDELRRRVGVDARVLDADAFRRESAYPPHIVDASRAGGCWLLSIDLLRQPDVTCLVTRTPWTQLVVDEAHLAAPGTARLAAVARVAQGSARVLLLSGTPTAAGIEGAETLRQLGCRDGEGAMPILCRASSGVARPARRLRWLHVALDPAHLALCDRLARFADRARRERGAEGLLPALVLRRRAASSPAAVVRSLAHRLQVLGETAPATAQPALFEHDETSDEDGHDDRLMHVDAWSDLAAERRELEALHRLAMRLPPGGRKLAAVARLARRAGEPLVVFTAYVDTLRALRHLLGERAVVVVHGRQPAGLREAALEAFTIGNADVLLTTDASAEGLNLQARCRLVVHAEVPASARLLQQRTGRVDRVGQHRRVHAVVMTSTTEEDQAAGRRLQEAARGSDAWVAQLSAKQCRRTRLAARYARAASPQAASDNGHIETPVIGARPRWPPERPTVTTLTPGRWQRLCRRLGATGGSPRLWVGQLHVARGARLARTVIPLAVLTPAGHPSPALWTFDEWRRHLPGALRRADHLTRRLDAWEDATRLAAQTYVLAHASPPALFDDAVAAEGPRQHARGGGSVCLEFVVRSVVERRR